MEITECRMMKRQRMSLIVVLLILAGCHQSDKSTDIISPNSIVNAELNNSVLQVPSNYHVLKSSLEYTSYIGTTDHPTINGGIINSADGTPVNHQMPIVIQRADPTPRIKPSKTVVNNQIAFPDSWATSMRVKKLLIVAASAGKLSYVLKKTNEMGLPASVAIVPMVESHYQTDAISPKGAVGAWQLMPSVAKDYGIQNQDRFQFTTSTDTALKLLNQLHHQFGNWQLVFAAYNAGSKRVEDALEKNPNAKNMDELDLPQETKIYVKQIMSLNKTMMELSIHDA